MPFRVVADATQRLSSIVDILSEYYCSVIPKHLPLLVLTPLVFVLVVSYRFFQSLHQPPPTRLLSYEVPPTSLNGSIVNIRQAAVIPPVFYHTCDRQMEDYLRPIKQLASSLPHQSEDGITFPLLVSSSDTATLVPECKQNQCISLAYLYTQPEDESPWLSTIAELTRGPLPQDKSFFFEQSEIAHATSPSFGDAPWELWPCDSPMPRIMATAAMLCVVIEWIRHWLAGIIRRRCLLFGVLILRIALSLIASISIASMVFSEFCFSVVKHFLLIPIFISATSLITSSRFLDKIPESSMETYNPLVRLTMACSQTSFAVALAQLVSGGILCYLSLFSPFAISTTMTPVMFVYGLSLILDTLLHYTLFLPAVYIDLVSQDATSYSSLDLTSVAISSNEEVRKKGRIPEVFSRLVRGFVQRCLLFDFYLRKKRAVVLFSFFAHGMATWCLVGHGWDALNSFQPDITRPTAKPEYVDLFVSTKNKFLDKFNVFNVFVPVIIPVQRGFKKPVATSRLLFGSLRYGNSWSIFFEIAALAVFIVSIGMITFLLFVPKHYLDLKFYLPMREKLYVSEIETNHDLDIMLLETCGTHVLAVSWDRKITIADVSSLQTDATSLKFGEALTLPLPSGLWPVKKLMLNPAYKTLAIFYGHCIELWSWKACEMVYHFQHEQALESLPIEAFFVGDSLILVTHSGRIVELYAKGEARVVHVLQNNTIKIAKKASSSKSAHVLLLLIDRNDRVYKARRNVLGEWETEELHIYESILAVSGTRIDAESYVTNGNLSPPNTSTNPYNVPWTQPSVRNDCFKDAVAMPDIEMLLLVSNTRVGFFDINTGLFLRYIQIGNYEPGSIRALHSQPTHCAFCGCPAVLSISIAYMDADQPGTLVCHTYQLRDRHRNDICLRVERDPRETRCLGLMSTMEQCHWLENVEVWEVSEINSLLGLRRRTSPTNEDKETAPQFSGSLSFVSEIQRRVRDYSSSSDQRSSESASEYEAFALSANGKLTCSEIDFGRSNKIYSTQLLEDKITAIGRVGSRSVCIGVGNTLKVLGLGQAQF